MGTTNPSRKRRPQSAGRGGKTPVGLLVASAISLVIVGLIYLAWWLLEGRNTESPEENATRLANIYLVMGAFGLLVGSGLQVGPTGESAVVTHRTQKFGALTNFAASMVVAVGSGLAFRLRLNWEWAGFLSSLAVVLVVAAALIWFARWVAGRHSDEDPGWGKAREAPPAGNWKRPPRD